MATSGVLLVTVAGDEPVVVDEADAGLVGQVIVDWFTANPSVPEVAVNVKSGSLVT